MHKEQKEFCLRVKEAHPSHFRGVSVLDVGSYDVNGTNRYLFTEDCEYVGLDLAPGPGVDVACPAQDYHPGRQFDVVISCECMEHNPYWAATFLNMYDLTKPGGLMVMTCATEGRPVHGTKSLEPENKEGWVTMPNTYVGAWDNEFYKNLTEKDFRSLLDINSCFTEYGFEVNKAHCDLYFYGIIARRRRRTSS